MCSEVNKMRRISRCFLTTLCLVFAVFIDLSQGSQRSGSTLNEDYDGGGAGGGGTDGHDDEQGYCAPYNGKVCKAFITGQVWYSRDDPNGGWQNEQITAALWDELISDLTGLCRSAAEVIIHSKASVILLFMGVGRVEEFLSAKCRKCVVCGFACGPQTVLLCGRLRCAVSPAATTVLILKSVEI